jgi:hypothetical protein
VFVSAQNLYRTNIAYLYVGSEISHKDFGWLALDHSLIERGVQEGTICPRLDYIGASVQISTT